MSSKIGYLLSMIYVVMFIALGVDLITIQYAYSALDSKSVSISYLISEHGTLDDSLIETIEKRYNVDFTCTGNCAPLFGDEVQYKISTEIKPIIVSKETITITINRSTVIGFYN